MVMFASCRTDYPYKDFYGNLGYDNSNSRVPVVIATNDSLYDADVYVYVFYTPTNVGSAPVDVNYSARMDSQDNEQFYCLIDDAENGNLGHGKKACMNEDMPLFLQWEDNGIVYYNNVYPQHRYKFFAYTISDAADMNSSPVREHDYVAYDIEINGTQDLACGYARVTEKQAQLFAGHSLQVYSAETGRLDLFPVLHMEHQLVSLRFNLMPGCVAVSSVCVKDMPYRGRFVVAAEDEERMGVAFGDETTDFTLSFENDVFLPKEDCYEIQFEGSAESIVLEMKDGGFKAGHKYMVEVSALAQDGIEIIEVN